MPIVANMNYSQSHSAKRTHKFDVESLYLVLG